MNEYGSSRASRNLRFRSVAPIAPIGIDAIDASGLLGLMGTSTRSVYPASEAGRRRRRRADRNRRVSCRPPYLLTRRSLLRGPAAPPLKGPPPPLIKGFACGPRVARCEGCTFGLRGAARPLSPAKKKISRCRTNTSQLSTRVHRFVLIADADVQGKEHLGSSAMPRT